MVECEICSESSRLIGQVDFSKNCEERRGVKLPTAGNLVSYWRCNRCSFVCAPEFRSWTTQDFLEKIYNEHYPLVDPDYLDVRSASNSRFITKLFGAHKHQIRHLDYGGGNGALSALLKNQAWNSTSFDPFPSPERAIHEIGKFDFITAFEVFEHVPNVHALMQNLQQLMDEPCFILFSTMMFEAKVATDEQLLNWWYLAPRNGHISLYSKEGMSILANKYKLTFASLDQGLHCFFNQVPSWAKHLIR